MPEDRGRKSEDGRSLFLAFHQRSSQLRIRTMQIVRLRRRLPIPSPIMKAEAEDLLTADPWLLEPG
jgi:hypothetical protein